jgi:hypothetical protein
MDALDITVEYLPWLSGILGIVLLILVPKKLIALGAFAVIMAIAVVVYHSGTKARHDRDTARVSLVVTHDANRCGSNTPLLVEIRNGSAWPVARIAWNVGAYMPGNSMNFVWYGRTGKEWEQPYSSDSPIAAGATAQKCLPVPTLQTSQFAHTLEYRAIYATMDFGD